MGKRYVSNDTAGIIFVGGVMIPPGDGREVDELLLPPEDEAPAEPLPEPDPHANLRELLTGNVKAVAGALEGLSDESLALLASIEAEGMGRKGVFGAIDELRLQRAAAKTGAPE